MGILAWISTNRKNLSYSYYLNLLFDIESSIRIAIEAILAKKAPQDKETILIILIAISSGVEKCQINAAEINNIHDTKLVANWVASIFDFAPNFKVKAIMFIEIANTNSVSGFRYSYLLQQIQNLAL